MTKNKYFSTEHFMDTWNNETWKMHLAKKNQIASIEISVGSGGHTHPIYHQ